MTFTFGIQADKDTDAGVNAGGGWIRYPNKDGEFQLRFLEEFEQWISYWEHFSMPKRCSYPCTGDRETCPGCNCGNEKEAKASKKFLMNALQSSGQGQGYVNLWKITASAQMRADLLRFRDKAGGTLTDRDYTIIRSTINGRTSYSIDREDKEPIKLEQYSNLLLDKQEALNEAYEIAWDDEKRAARDKEYEERKKANESKGADKRATNGNSAPKQAKQEPVPDELKTPEEKMAAAGEEFFGKPKLAAVPEPEEDITLTLSDIRKMDTTKLKELFRRSGFDTPETDDQQVLADQLIAELSN